VTLSAAELAGAPLTKRCSVSTTRDCSVTACRWARPASCSAARGRLAGVPGGQCRWITSAGCTRLRRPPPCRRRSVTTLRCLRSHWGVLGRHAAMHPGALHTLLARWILAHRVPTLEADQLGLGGVFSSGERPDPRQRRRAVPVGEFGGRPSDTVEPYIAGPV